MAVKKNPSGKIPTVPASAPDAAASPQTGTTAPPSGTTSTTSTALSGPATADDVAFAASLPASSVSHVRPLSRALIDLCGSAGTQQMVATYKSELETVVSLDVPGFVADATQGQKLCDAYARLSESVDRVGFAIRTVNKALNTDAELLAKAGKTAVSGSAFYTATQGFVVQRQAIRGSRKGAVTRRKNSQAKKSGAAAATTPTNGAGNGTASTGSTGATTPAGTGTIKIT